MNIICTAVEETTLFMGKQTFDIYFHILSSSAAIHCQILKQTTHSDAQLGIEAASNLVL